jgi:hypothetical protein
VWIAIIWGCVAATITQANLLIAWQATSGFYFPGTPDTGILNMGESTIAQLIFSADAAAGRADPGNVVGQYVSGNDSVLQQITVSNTGGLYEDYAYFGSQNYDGVFQSGYVFCRVFEDNTPLVGEWVFDSVPVETQDLAAPQPPQTIEMNADLISGDPMTYGPAETVAMGYKMGSVIPEPTSLALCGIGVLTLVVRKLRRR